MCREMLTCLKSELDSNISLGNKRFAFIICTSQLISRDMIWESNSQIENV